MTISDLRPSLTRLVTGLMSTGRVFMAALGFGMLIVPIVLYRFDWSLTPDEAASLIIVPLIILYLSLRTMMTIVVSKFEKEKHAPEQAHQDFKWTLTTCGFALATLLVIVGALATAAVIPSVGIYYLMGMTWAIVPGMKLAGVGIVMALAPIVVVGFVKFIRDGGLQERCRSSFDWFITQFHVDRLAFRSSHHGPRRGRFSC